MGASTPHFALQIRNRIARLIQGPAGRSPGAAGGRARDRALATLGFTGEIRGMPGEEGLPPLGSVSAAPSPTPSGNLHG